MNLTVEGSSTCSVKIVLEVVNAALGKLPNNNFSVVE